MRRHSASPQYGFSLLELMLSLALSSLLILSLCTLASKITLTAVTRHNQVLARQTLMDLQRLLTKEIHRAGFRLNGEEATVFQGEHQVLVIDNEQHSLGMVYQVVPSGESAFRHLFFVYQPSHKMLRLCEKWSATPLSVTIARTSLPGNACYSLLDPMQFSVQSFHANRHTVQSDGKISGVVDIEIMLSDRFDVIRNQTVSFSVTQRNWI